ncbi:ABC transporter substrate-binding protein [Anaerovorax odorimutans]|uniref:ABC transporter substrate-binding protein n=1 Tax=Anaerovorax odorimutans TaxID=109327 RepID=UPI000422B9EF|nr:ABC transporter substrate-binding protein [Anaerovorax odorimutans]
MLKKIITITIVLVMVISLSGCDRSDGFLGRGANNNTEKVTSSDIYIPIEKLRTLNPIVSKDEDAYYINKLIYDGLFQLNNNLEIEPVLAESYNYTNDGYSVTIYLKSGIKWHDGNSFTANDVKFTIDAYKSAGTKCIYHNYVNNISSVTAKNSNTVVVNFNNNKNVAIENFIFPIIPKHQFKNISQSTQEDVNFIPIGTGKYKVKDYDSYFELVLVANEEYNLGKTANNKILFQVMRDKKDALNLIDMNTVSISFAKEIDRDTDYTNKDVEVTSFPSNEVEFIGFNFSNEYLKNKKIRQAIAHAIDTKNIIETGYYQSGVVNDNIYYPNYLGVDSSNDKYDYDIDKATELITEAGYVDNDGDGKVENEDGEVLRVNILVNNNPARVVAAQSIKNGLDKLPIESNIIDQEWDVYNNSLKKGDFDIFIGGYKIEDIYDMRFMLHSGFSNIIRYSNPNLDLLLDKMQSGISKEEKLSTFKKIKKILDDEIPYYCLLYKTYGAITPKSFKGELYPMFNDFYRDCGDWKCIYEKQEGEE